MDSQIDFNSLECVYKKPVPLIDVHTRYCPGCGHGVAHKVLMEAIEELGIQQEVIGVASVGCSVFAYDYLDIDMQQAAHGRACAVATGIKRILPSKYVFTYQGDGDLAAIGTAETLHTANRGENILIIFINNAIYGMTGGQMAPTTIEGMKTTTSPYGRDTKLQGFPLKIADLIAMLPGVAYVTRQAVISPNHVRQFKKAVMRGFQYQRENRGTCLIELVSNCPSGWKMEPIDANQWLEANMLPNYPLGDLKVPEGEVKRS